jgi:Mg2+ and Co2+ transporter CorA
MNEAIEILKPFLSHKKHCNIYLPTTAEMGCDCGYDKALALLHDKSCPECGGSGICKKCPKCGENLRTVTQSPQCLMNPEQFEATRAGDFYCPKCFGDRGKSGMRYFWKDELTCPSCQPKEPKPHYIPGWIDKTTRRGAKPELFDGEAENEANTKPEKKVDCIICQDIGRTCPDCIFKPKPNAGEFVKRLRSNIKAYYNTFKSLDIREAIADAVALDLEQAADRIEQLERDVIIKSDEHWVRGYETAKEEDQKQIAELKAKPEAGGEIIKELEDNWNEYLNLRQRRYSSECDGSIKKAIAFIKQQAEQIAELQAKLKEAE